MVNIVTCGINQGKTCKMLSIYAETLCGDGFVTQKLFNKETFCGYEILHLKTGESMPFICFKQHIPIYWNEELQFGRFSFSKDGFAFAQGIIRNILQKGMSPIYIDEIGPVELTGNGFCQILKTTLNRNRDLFISVRISCVEDVIRAFNISEYRIVYL